MTSTTNGLSSTLINDSSRTPTPQIRVSVNKVQIDEGQNVSFLISTSGIPAGSLLDDNLNGSGLTPADVGNAPLAGKLVVDRNGNVIDDLLVLDGSNDGGTANAFSRTGITVTTIVNPTFLNQEQELASVGLRFQQAVNTFRITAIQQAEAEGAIRFNGPDLKVLALDSSEASTLINDSSRSRTPDPIIGGTSRALVDTSPLPTPALVGAGGTGSGAGVPIQPRWFRAWEVSRWFRNRPRMAP